MGLPFVGFDVSLCCKSPEKALTKVKVWACAVLQCALSFFLALSPA
jgi:hypothetical protein